MSDTTATTERFPLPVPVIVLALWPSALILWDMATLANPGVRILTMPIPVVLGLLALIAYAAGSGAFRATRLLPHLLAPDTGSRPFTILTIAIFGLATILAALQAAHPMFAFVKIAELTLATAAALAFAALAIQSGKGFAIQLAMALFVGTVAAVALCLGLYLTGLPESYGTLLLPGFVHIRVLGFSLAFAIAAGAGLWLQRRTFTDTAFLGAGLTLLWACLFWSGGRGALAALGASFLILALVIPAVRKSVLPLCATAVIGLGLSLLLPSGGASFGMASRLADAAAAGSADTLASGRIEMWRTLLAALADSPWTGVGYAQANYIYIEAGFAHTHVHAHNIVIDAALALGWPGAALLGGVCLAAWLRALALARQTGCALTATGVVLVTVFLAHALVDGVYFYHQATVPLAIGVALLIFARREAFGRAPSPA